MGESPEKSLNKNQNWKKDSICPLMTTSCLKDGCSWWVPEIEMCSITLIAVTPFAEQGVELKEKTTAGVKEGDKNLQKEMDVYKRLQSMKDGEQKK
jgi:hypothetical protein